MFELRRQGFVPRHRCPVIGQDLGFRAAKVDHRLDGKEHALFQHRRRAGPAIVQHVRRGVKHPAQPVPAEVAHNAHPLRFDIGLNGMTDVAKGIAGTHRLDALHQRIMGHLDQTLGLARQVSGHIHPACVAEPAIDDHGHVDVQNIAVLQRLRSGNPVADDVVHRNARGVLIALVADRRRNHAAPRHLFRDDAVQRLGGHTGYHKRSDQIQDLCRHPACCCHAGKIRILIDADSVPCDASASLVQNRRSLMFRS